MDILAYRLKELRRNANLTQIELSKLTHINRRTISGYETGALFPTIETLLILSKFFKVSIDYLTIKDCKFLKEINQLSDEEQKEISEILDYINWKNSKQNY